MNIKRISLLSDTEITDLYSMPDFNQDEKELYLTLNERECVIINNYSTIKTRVFFILQLGYFKAKQQFFKFDLADVQSDVEYAISHFFTDTGTITSGRISRDYITRQKNDILKLFDYREWSPKYAPQAESHLCELLRYYPKSHSALRQLLTYFEAQKIIIPSYRNLQDMFTAAYSAEEIRISSIILSIPNRHQEQLSGLINQEDRISRLNIIRADQKDFQYTAVRAEVEKAQNIVGLYEFSKEFIPTLKLSKNAVRYYSDIAEQYAASRLRQINQPQQWLHAICFIHHRYQQIMDNLIISFIYHVKTIMDAGKDYAEAAMMEHASRIIADFPKLSQFLQWFPKREKELTYEELSQVAYKILPEEQFPALAEFLDGNTFDKKSAKWKCYLESSRQFTLYLRPILVTVPFVFYKKNSQLMKLISLIKMHYIDGKSPSALKLPDDILSSIPKSMMPYLKREPDDEHIDPHLFEFFVYQKMHHQLDRGRLCCNDSVSYCDIDHDLIDDVLVDNVEKIAAEFGYPKIPIYCDKRLDDALEMLEHAWNQTTENIQLGYNTGFKIKQKNEGQQVWSLLYDSSEELDDAFFKTLPKVEIADVLMFIGNRIDMWNGFTHIKGRYIKRKKPIPLAINACLLSEAFGFGVKKMAEMSDIDMQLLRGTRQDFIRIDTLCGVNDMAANHIYSLPIFTLWNLLENKIIADADGQKFSTSDSTIQSRYSKKYLGKGRGISLYTLIANFVAVNAKNIGLNEYEGHALYDMIYNNKTDIDIDMVTGDNHSLNQLNFIALDSIDVDYVPSIKNVREAANDLYSVKSPDHYTGLLQPKDKIKIDRIKSQKKGILRVLLSLIMQENTQSNIIRKLNSHARYTRLKAGLFEYNKIFKSIHVLNLIDNIKLRKILRTARNRTEAYHQLQGLIRKIYSGVFKGKKIVDNRISAHAARLIANCIIAYNSIILNTVYEKMIQSGVKKNIIEEFSRISPIAWIHILFTGRYSFYKSNGNIDVVKMAKMVEMHLKEHFWEVV
jgi:TnpA family transposase